MKKANVLLIIVLASLLMTNYTDVLQISQKGMGQNTTKENMVLHTYTMDNADVTPPVELSDEDFIVRRGSISIELDGDYENLIANEQLLNYRLVDEKHAYNTYSYKNFVVSTTPVENAIWRIGLLTPEFSTYRGIVVGASILSVFEKYGLAEANSIGCYSYRRNGNILSFYADEDGIVVQIVLEML